MGQLQVLEFPLVCPAGFLLGTEKEENKPPGLNSSASSHLGESKREKLIHNLLSLDMILQPAPFPQDTILLAGPTTAPTPTGCLGVQLAQGLI